MTLRGRIKDEEGLSLSPYPCPTGHASIGYGRNLEAKGLSPAEWDLVRGMVDPMFFGRAGLTRSEWLHGVFTAPITTAMADTLLDHDIAGAEQDVGQALPWSTGLDDIRRDVLAEMTFNMGIGGLGAFTKALAAMQTGDFVRAAFEMLDSRWLWQVKGRAVRLARQMALGEEP